MAKGCNHGWGGGSVKRSRQAAEAAATGTPSAALHPQKRARVTRHGIKPVATAFKPPLPLPPVRWGCAAAAAKKGGG